MEALTSGGLDGSTPSSGSAAVVEAAVGCDVEGSVVLDEGNGLAGAPNEKAAGFAAWEPKENELPAALEPASAAAPKEKLDEAAGLEKLKAVDFPWLSVLGVLAGVAGLPNSNDVV
jgi:hypothetical protein